MPWFKVLAAMPLEQYFAVNTSDTERYASHKLSTLSLSSDCKRIIN